jgi:prepilin signal peptidase PulO-like enzyme (type II secretory pathway)
LDQVLLITFVVLFGLAVGSFLGAVSYRVPRGLSIVQPPSSCPACRTRLTIADLMPVLSHLRARGRCRHCGAPVPWRYTLIEVMTALGFIGAYSLAWARPLAAAAAGSSPPVTALTSVDWPLFAVGAVLVSLMIVMTVIDLEHMLLPDKINILGAAAGLGFALWGTGPVAPLQALFGALLGFAVIVLIVLLSKGGMGMGDAKFLAMLGTFVGPLGVLYTLFGASLLGAITGGILIWRGRHGRKTPMPFGPFLATAVLGVWTYLILFP